MTRRNHAFSTEEAPTTPACRRGRRVLVSSDDEVPTTLRRSSTIRARAVARPMPRTVPPPLPSRPPPLPTHASLRATHAPLRSTAPPLPRPRIRSLASILEPEEERCTVTPARFLVLPPDPMAFDAKPKPKKPKLTRDSVRWLVRSVLMMIVLVEELVLAAPAGMLHPPRDVSDAATMLASAVRSSATAALGR